MISNETIKKTFLRILYSGIAGALSAFVLMPINLEEPQKYLYALIIGMGTGFLMGLQKAISGYIKYDRNKE